MPWRKNKSEEHNPDRSAEHRDEELESREEYRADPDGSYARQNDQLVRFQDELKQVNEQFAADFDNRKNPAEYAPEERREALEAVQQAFNNTEWNGDPERWKAAMDVSHNLFQPMYHRVEIAEAAAQHNLSTEFVEELKKEEIEYLEVKVAEDGLPGEVLQFRVKDYETAQRLAEQSDGRFHVARPEELDFCKNRFAQALYNSKDDPEAMKNMEQYLDRAIAHYRGEEPSVGSAENEDGQAEGNLEAGTDEEYRTETPEEHRTQEKSRFSFQDYEAMSEQELEHALRERVEERTRECLERLESMRAERHRDAETAHRLLSEKMEQAQDGLRDAVEAGDQQAFNSALESLDDLENYVDNREGFIQAEGYYPPELKREFTEREDLDGYLTGVEETLEQLEGRINPEQEREIREMRDRLERRMESHDESAVPMDRDELAEAHRSAQALNYMMRPHDPEVWEAWANPDLMADHRNQYVAGAPDDTRRTVEKALAHVLETPEKRMMLQVENGENVPEQEFAENYRHFLDKHRELHQKVDRVVEEGIRFEVDEIPPALAWNERGQERADHARSNLEEYARICEDVGTSSDEGIVMNVMVQSYHQNREALKYADPMDLANRMDLIQEMHKQSEVINSLLTEREPVAA